MPVDDQAGRRPPGALESEILDVLVRATAPLTPREVLERLPGPPRLSYSTVVTILTRMHTKEMLARFREGRAFRYAPLTDGASLAAERMRSLLDTSDHATVLRRFVDTLQPGDEELLRRLLRDD